MKDPVVHVVVQHVHPTPPKPTRLQRAALGIYIGLCVAHILRPRRLW